MPHDMRHTASSQVRRRSARGATFVEYALLMGLFAAACIGGMNVMNKESGEKVQTVSTNIGQLPDVEGTVTTP
jgi:Flp pilus assembly pilin Flp